MLQKSRCGRSTLGLIRGASGTLLLLVEARVPNAVHPGFTLLLFTEHAMKTTTTASATSVSVVGRTHTIVRLQTRIRRKDGTENFGGFVYVLDGFPQRDFVLWVFMCPINISLFCVSFVFSLVSFPATTPRATTPHLYLSLIHI